MENLPAQRELRLLLSGGGTGGHVYPILAVLDALRREVKPAQALATPDVELPADSPSRAAAPAEPRDSADVSPGHAARSQGARPLDAQARPPASASPADARPRLALLYVGTAGSVEEELALRAGIAFRSIDSGQLRGTRPWVAAGSLIRVGRGTRQASRILAEFRPHGTFVTGGFVAAPVVWASWRAGVPVFIYLPDVEPGLAVRRLSRFARQVAVSFPEVASYFPGKAIVTGYPVRAEFVDAAAAGPGPARQALGLTEDLPVVLVFGGSRGARSINVALADALPGLLPHCQVVHVSGTLDWPHVAERAGDLPDALLERYHPYPYLHDEMTQAMAAANLVIARAGASTLGEFPLMNLPSILVPYPYSGQHQEANADYLEEHGAAIKLADAGLSKTLLPTVLRLLEDRAVLDALRLAASSLARPDAADNIASALLELMGEGGE